MAATTGGRGLYKLIWPLLAAMALLAVVAVLGIYALSAVRAYIGGEAHWSRAQKQAVIHLMRYAESGLESELDSYRRAIGVNFGDRDARLALLAKSPDVALARRGLLAGGNHPEDIDRMITLFRVFRLDPGVRQAFEAWAAADELLVGLDVVAKELAEEMRASGPRTWRARTLARAAVELDGRVTPHAETYSMLLNQSARRIATIIWSAGGMLFFLVLTWAIVSTRRSLERLQSAESQQLAAEQQLAQLAQYDALTGLPNRALFHDRLGQAIARAHRSERQIAVLFLDLDRFKEINDSFGHEAGDRVLIEAAERMRLHLREGDSVARLGGDEFTVILEDVGDAEQVRAVAQKLLRAFAEPFRIDGQDLFVTLSIGIALHPRDGADAESLLRHADTAMYQAKSDGRDGLKFYTPVMSTAVSERLSLEGRLRQALERGEFVLHYQPIVRLEDGTISSVEALLRWRHPEEGLLPPGRFVGIAEQTGLIVPIGDWVLHEACTHAAQWQAAGLRPLRVAVNLSARQFRKGRMVDAVRSALEAARLDSRWLMLEITESLLMENPEASGKVLQQLKEMGAHMALDDFGTGYSSLAYLKHFPIDVIKIDRSFVRDIVTDVDDAAIVKATIGLATSLGMQTTAEGVEIAEQLAFLRTHGCRFGQGYLFSPPVAEEEFAAMLRQERRLAAA
ncbi:MAG: EAL domain-containing protein [Burkholderiales bacterium]